MRFAVTDWIVVGVYLALVVAVGLLARRRDDDPFLAGRSMPVLPVAISLVVTALSTATFLGAPQKSYGGDLTYLAGQIGGMIAAVVVAFVFVPAFFRAGVVSVYELIGHAYGNAPRRAASATFLVGRVFASGARLYLVGIPVSLITFGDLAPMHLVEAIVFVGIIAAAYTAFGGIRAVIWTDVLQAVVILGTIGVVIGLLLKRIDAPTSAVVDVLTAEGKLRIIEPAFDPSNAFTIWAAVIGVAMLNIAAFGTDQDLTQRLLTCRDGATAIRAMLSSAIIGAGVVALFLLTGLLLYVCYQHPELTTGPVIDAPDDSRKILLHFALTELPPALRGLMIAGVLAAAMSSLDSALNAMTTAAVTDFAPRLRGARATAGMTAAWAIVLIAFASFCVWWQTFSPQPLIEFALSVMVYAYSGLLAVFLCAIVTRRGSGASSIAALAAGFIVTAATEPAFWPDEHTIAFSWRMVISTMTAFGVCLAGKRRVGQGI